MRAKKNRVSKEQLASTRGLIGPTTTITTADGDSFEADLTSVVLPLTTVPRFSQAGLDLIANQGMSSREFFKTLRAAKYSDEWKWLTSLQDVGTREWKMVALSFCAQVAVECHLLYPFLEPEPRYWLRDKFIGQGVPDDFDARWEAYLNHCRSGLGLLQGRIYLHIGERLRFKWFGAEPDSPHSEKYRMVVTEGSF